MAESGNLVVNVVVVGTGGGTPTSAVVACGSIRGAAARPVQEV